MITSAKGNILDADVDAVVNTVNTVGVMGKGLALQFKRRYPENFDLYKRACDSNELEVGRMFVTETHQLSGPRLIVNFPTKQHWKANSRIEFIRDGLRDLVSIIRDRGITSIAIPPLGAGNGGLEWTRVRPIIEEALAPLEDVDVRIFDPVQRSFDVAADRPVRLTNSRALLLALMLGYAKQRHALEPWEDMGGASHLEVQKLMYFASLRIPALRLRFARGTYGPYSDVVRIMLQELEGTYSKGFGDGNDKVLALKPIEVTQAGIDALDGFKPSAESAREFDDAIAGVLHHIEGFEGAYPLELLASVEWAVNDLRTGTRPEVTRYVQTWTKRKGRMFTEAHIGTALARVNPS